MDKRKRLSASEAAVLDLQLPVGLTDEMRDVAYCLYEALVLTDSRAGTQSPGPAWRNVLASMARMAVLQLQHLSREKGGRSIYLAKGEAARLSARDLEMCAKFRGDYDSLADEYGLTPMRVRQIMDAYQRERFLARQGRLPGIDAEIS